MSEENKKVILNTIDNNIKRMDKKLDDMSDRIKENSYVTNKILREVLKTNQRLDKHREDIDNMAHKIDKIEDKQKSFKKINRTKLQKLLDKIFNK